jgi:hypothetical protein
VSRNLERSFHGLFCYIISVIIYILTGAWIMKNICQDSFLRGSYSIFNVRYWIWELKAYTCQT